MISKIKKPISILLVFMMIVSLFAVVPITASAAEETITVHSNTDKLSNHGIQNMNSYGEHSDFDGSGLPWGTFVAPEGKVFTKIVTNGASRGAMNWTGSAERVKHDNMMGEWYIDFDTDEDGFRPFTISFTLADATPTYTVTWKNGDTTLKTDTVEKDAIPAYTGETPVKAEDANYTYTFSGWTDSSNTFYSKDGNLPAVTKDETYTATFASEDKAVKNVITLINALPAAAEITAADKVTIEAARAAYNALNGDQKALVTNLDKLTTAETALAAAENLFPQHSVSLGGDIGVNFYIDPAAARADEHATVSVEFSWNGQTETVTAVYDPDMGLFKATCNVVAAEVACDITAVATVNGEKQTQTDTYSVQDYAEAVYNNPAAYDSAKPVQLAALAKALLNYGAMAQTVFEEYMTQPVKAPADIVKTVEKTDFNTVSADDIAAAIKGSASNLNTAAAAFDAEFYTSSLIYLSRNTLRLYFTPASKTVGALDGKGFSGNLSEYYYYVEKENIAAAELDDQQSFTIGDKTFTFSALDYAKAVVNSGMGDDQKNLAKALYLYNQKANAYFDDAPAPVENVVDLGTLQGDYEAQNNDVLTGVLSGDKKISIADGATITLRDANITLSSSAQYAGITPLGDATILLEETNTVKGGNRNYPGIYVPAGKTLIIDGTGSLNASSHGCGCGIGGGFEKAAGNTVINGGTITATGGEFAAGIGSGQYGSCGNITITGGTITANGGDDAAGIGSGDDGSCGNILITGGTVTANGRYTAAGIGSGYEATCGNITIADTVTQVTATKGKYSPNSIGAGDDGTCGTVTIAPGANVIQN